MISPFLLTLLLPVVAARRGGSSGSFGSTVTNFDAPPLEKAYLAVSGFLFIATLVQLGQAGSALSRTRSPHRGPAIATIIALLVIAISHALHVANVVAEFTVDDFGNQKISLPGFLGIDVPSVLFFEWQDPLVFLAVALLLRDRHRAHSGDAMQKVKRGVSLLPFTVTATVLTVLMMLFVIGIAGLYVGPSVALYNASITRLQYNALGKISDGLFYTSVALYILATLFLIPFAFVVKHVAYADRVASLALTALVPILVLRAIARLVIVILQAHFATLISFTTQDGYVLTFASSLVWGVLYLAAMGVLIACLTRLPARDAALPYGFQAHQQAYYATGSPPPAQFPGQWGYTTQHWQPAPQAPHYYPNVPPPPQVMSPPPPTVSSISEEKPPEIAPYHAAPRPVS